MHDDEYFMAEFISMPMPHASAAVDEENSFGPGSPTLAVRWRRRYGRISLRQTRGTIKAIEDYFKKK